ncbi:MAG: hypothetical protein L6N96_03915 [Candidatus Methylarchaceae archaeon HK02M2]|nr:hypothetical protein [Candidatus Methylarchaceae archaeon HK02M2]
MNKIRVALIGGFYATGKTTTIVRLGKKLSEEGKRVAVITNDKGVINVDGEVIKSLGFEAVDITGGCICYYLDRVSEVVKTISKKFIPDIILIEPVAYFLPSKLYEDLGKELSEKLDVAPITILVDGSQLVQYDQEGKELPFIESRQIEDAEVVLINKIDLVPPDKIQIIEKIVQEINPRARLIKMSAKTGTNLDELFDIVLHGKHEVVPAVTMTVIKTFARSVTEIGERGEQYTINAKEILTESKVKNFLRDLLEGIGKKVQDTEAEISHLKAYVSDGVFFIKASLVRLGQEVDFVSNIKGLSSGRIIINAIGRGLPDDFLYGLMVKTLQETAPRYGIVFRLE